MKWNPFPNTSKTRELDLRVEMNRFLFGAPDEVAKGAFYILRSMNTREGVVEATSAEDLIPCACKTGPSNEPELTYRCNICDGEGYLFTDKIITAYKTDRFEYQDVEKYMKWGKNTIAMSFFYVEPVEMITRYDKIIEPLTDREGKLVSPIKAVLSHNIHMAEKFKSDNGRTEYWRLSCYSE